MENNIYYVYLHRRNDTNEVFYVGKGQAKRAYDKIRRSKWWHHIVDKAGGFTVEFIEKGLSEVSALDLEIEIIKFYRECNYKLCNLTDGGDGMSGYKATEETRKKQSDAAKGHTHNRGRKLSEESKKSLAFRNKKKKPVRCSNGMAFAGCPDAAEWLRSIGFVKATNTSVADCARGRRKLAYGFSWTYIDAKSPEGLALLGKIKPIQAPLQTPLFLWRPPYQTEPSLSEHLHSG